MGVLTSVDRALLAAYCQSWALWREAEDEVRKSGQVVKSTNGSTYMNPWLQAAISARKDMTKLAAELGMSPSNRSRMTVPKEDESAEPSLADMLFNDPPGEMSNDHKRPATPRPSAGA